MGQGKKRIYTQKKLTPKKSKAERKKARSPNGFLALMTGFVGMCAWTLWGAVKKERADLERSKNIRVRLMSKPLVFSPHASCRMDCRFVDKAAVISTLKNGRVNDRKSNPNARPCPRYAIDEGRVQAVFADCYKDTPVVTVIDTETNHPCGPC
mmetsp:Transcript_47038/g.89816  ORF Transcript_47038/g.89816 Transcript_47038/m.89816 type:complete len:153 (+) Transcript_47038:168-626(+)